MKPLGDGGGLKPLDSGGLQPFGGDAGGGLQPLGDGGGLQPIGGGGGGLQPVGGGLQPLGGGGQMQPLAPATPSSNPYLTPTPTKSSHSRQRGNGTGIIITVAVLNFISAALIFIISAFALLGIFIGGVAVIGILQQEQSSAFVAGGIIGIGVMLIVLLVFVLIGVLILWTGIGLLKRQQWARISAIILASLTIIFILWNILSFGLSLNVFALIKAGMQTLYVVLTFIAVIQYGDEFD